MTKESEVIEEGTVWVNSLTHEWKIYRNGEWEPLESLKKTPLEPTYEQGFKACKAILSEAIQAWLESQIPGLKEVRPIKDIIEIIESVEVRKKKYEQ